MPGALERAGLSSEGSAGLPGGRQASAGPWPRAQAATRGSARRSSEQELQSEGPGRKFLLL